MSQLREFLAGAKDLSRNPLGIVALFIGFVYGLATLLIGIAGEKLTPDERMPIIWFIVLFPPIVLGSFYQLVAKHHGKLYGPGDYRTDQSFLDTLGKQSLETIATRIAEEVEVVRQTDVAASMKADDGSAKAEDLCEVAAALVSNQRSSPSQVPVKSVSSTSSDEIRVQVVDAERLAIRKIEKELGKFLIKEVSFEGHPGLVFDAVNVGRDALQVIEVKFVRTGIPSSAVFREIVYRAALLRTAIRKETAISLLLVVVYAIKEPARVQTLEKRVRSAADKSLLPVDIRMLELDALRREFPDQTGE